MLFAQAQPRNHPRVRNRVPCPRARTLWRNLRRGRDDHASSHRSARRLPSCRRSARSPSRASRNHILETMRERRSHYNRALAVDPTSFGLGFAVLEDQDRLVDWGGKWTTSKNRNAQCVAAVVALVRSYEPDLVVLEDCAAPGS